MINKVILVGNLTRDPEIKEFADGGKIANFGVATSDRAFTTKNGQQIPEKTEFHNLVVSGKMADVMQKYLKKGDRVYIEGKIRYISYDGTDGTKKYITEIHVSDLKMLGGKKDLDKPQSDNSTPLSSDDD